MKTIKHFKKYLFLIALIGFLVVFTGCQDDIDPPAASTSSKMISLATIPDVGVPKIGKAPIASAIDTTQYTGTVTWDPADSPYAASKVYTATITLTAKSGYTLAGVTKNFFTVAEAITVTNPINSGVVKAVFPATAATPPKTIPGVVAPAFGIAPDTTAIDMDGYTGTVAWSPTNDPYLANTAYTATITLTPKPEFSEIVEVNSFLVVGATTVINSAEDADASVTVTAVFPKTAAEPLAKVNLGTAADYVILAKAAISTTGTTAITGDLGLSPAATTYITGFALVDATGYATSTYVTGEVFASDMALDPATKLTTAVSNMEAAYTDAATRPTPNHLNMASGAIGGLTLSPGLYKWEGSVVIGSDLTLKGGADDVWIFQISNDLNLASDKKVLLSGGAKAENIFWQVAEIATLGTNSTMKGNILSMTKIVLMNGASIQGRMLAQTAVTLDAVTIVGP